MKNSLITLIVLFFSFASCQKNDITPVVAKPVVFVYPNPFTDFVTVDFETTEDWTITLLTSGQKEINTVSGKGNSQRSFSFQDYDEEILICQVKIGSTVYIHQLINARK